MRSTFHNLHLHGACTHHRRAFNIDLHISIYTALAPTPAVRSLWMPMHLHTRRLRTRTNGARNYLRRPAALAPCGWGWLDRCIQQSPTRCRVGVLLGGAILLSTLVSCVPIGP